MTVLGIETASTVCGAAVVRNEELLGEAVIEERHAHTAMLIHQIEEALSRSRIRLEDLDGVAVSIGPGSFTGLRIGVSVAKGLAWGAGRRITGVPTLRALARSVVESEDVKGPADMLTVLDSRKDEVYYEHFTFSGEDLISAGVTALASPAGLMEHIRERRLTVVTTSVQFRERSSAEMHLRFLPPERCRCSASAVALEGASRFRRGLDADPALLEPEYGVDVQTTLRNPH